MLTDNFPEIEISAICANVEEGVVAIQNYKPNLVFLDVEIPPDNGV